MRQYYVYIMSNRTHVLYIGVTNDLDHRVGQHQQGANPGFTQRYHLKRLVYFESYDKIADAISREKQLKGWRRSKKIALIESLNPRWSDRSREWFPWMTDSGASIGPSSTPDKKASSVEPSTKCHPERSNSVREANGIVRSE